jgi:hypothetical protein
VLGAENELMELAVWPHRKAGGAREAAGNRFVDKTMRQRTDDFSYGLPG